MTTTATDRRTLPPQDPRHGTTAGASAGCLCPRCGTAKRNYNRTRYRKTGYGTWQPFIDAEPVREHLRHLSANGIGWIRAANLAGLKRCTVSAILYGRPGFPPNAKIRPTTAAKILAVQATPDLLADHAPVPAAGTVRRLRALAALGYPMQELAEQLPIGYDQAIRIAARAPRTVTNAVARATVTLYDRMSLTVPPTTWVHQRAQRTALARGWVPPLAWDDATIDDPNAHPNTGEADTGQDVDEQDVDEVLVRRALTGHAPLTTLNDAEQIALWQSWERQRRERLLDGPGLKEFARLHGVKTHIAERLRNTAHGLTAKGKPPRRNTNTAATGHTNERTAA